MTLPFLYVIGTGGFAKELAQAATAINQRQQRWRAIAYIAQSGQPTPQLPFGEVAGTDQLLTNLTEEAHVAIGVGEPLVRAKIAARLSAHSWLHFPNLIHPKAEVDEAAVRLGYGNFFASGSVLTCDIEIGNHNLFNLNTTVGHDSRIGSCNVVNPGANISGQVTIGDCCLIGTGAQLLPHVTLVNEVILGAGAVAIRPITEPGVYTGVPARKK